MAKRKRLKIEKQKIAATATTLLEPKQSEPKRISKRRIRIVEPCRKCGSTKHTEYKLVTTKPILGCDNTGEFDSISWYTTQCQKCGQWRIDKTKKYKEQH